MQYGATQRMSSCGQESMLNRGSACGFQIYIVAPNLEMHWLFLCPSSSAKSTACRAAVCHTPNSVLQRSDMLRLSHTQQRIAAIQAAAVLRGAVCTTAVAPICPPHPAASHALRPYTQTNRHRSTKDTAKVSSTDILSTTISRIAC
jgi:hypothetical protein